MAKPKRMVAGHCCGVIVDVQGFFLSQIDKRLRVRIKSNTGHFARLLGYFKIPIIVTLERSVEQKGSLPREIADHLSVDARTFEKDYFDLSKERPIRNHLARLKRRQVIVAGCETDVCVLASVLTAVDRGYRTIVVSDAVTSSSAAAHRATLELILPRFDQQIELVETQELLRHW